MSLCTWCVDSQLSYCMSKQAQGFSWKSSIFVFSLMCQSLPPWAKVVQQYCSPHHPKQTSLVFWEDSLKLGALIWKRLSQNMGLMPVKFSRKAAQSKIQVVFPRLLERLLELQLLQFVRNTESRNNKFMAVKMLIISHSKYSFSPIRHKRILAKFHS